MPCYLSQSQAVVNLRLGITGLDFLKLFLQDLVSGCEVRTVVAEDVFRQSSSGGETTEGTQERFGVQSVCDLDMDSSHCQAGKYTSISLDLAPSSFNH